eukprot:TRINITY_DN5686_c0_g1_i2.p1 TRINITY_DN5686_c0_g1~~TRINITY_DN5686_c0_g1_i2.p1  ORF type:complete len:360 (+),score=55.00 TRINITY_DN5686_c0_g1_i2:61-1080(+)
MCIRDRYQRRVHGEGSGVTEQMVIAEADVVCCTCFASTDKRLDGFSFPIVLIDEATMAVEPMCIQPFTKGANRVILVGDQNQLGPVVKSTNAKQAGYARSMFERLLEQNIPLTMLDTQYRMHPDISWFPCLNFYAGKLKDGINKAARPLPPAIRLPSSNSQNFFIHVEGGREVLCEKGRSYKNEEELRVVSAYVQYLVEICKVEPQNIGVITPYKAQQEHFLANLHPDYKKIEIKSVDGYQGREKEFILISCVRTNQMGFLNDPRRLNVAITRARTALILFGNAKFLSIDELWRSLIKHYSNSGWIFEGEVAEWKPIKIVLRAKENDQSNGQNEKSLQS